MWQTTSSPVRPASSASRAIASVRRSRHTVVCGIADLSNEKYADLSENERKVIAAISGNRLHADEITEKTGLDISAVNAALVVLELESLIARLDGNQYIII